MPGLNKIICSLVISVILMFNACAEKKSGSDTARQSRDSATRSTLSPSDFRRASLEGEIEKVRQATEGGINVNLADEAGRTPLMLASYNGHAEVVRHLLEQGARISDRDATGRTALIFAASGPFPKTVELLLEGGADPNITDQAEGWSALMFGAAGGHLQVVNELLDAGADVLLKDRDGETAIDFARKNSHREIIKVLKGVQGSE